MYIPGLRILIVAQRFMGLLTCLLEFTLIHVQTDMMNRIINAITIHGLWKSKLESIYVFNPTNFLVDAHASAVPFPLEAAIRSRSP